MVGLDKIEEFVGIALLYGGIEALHEFQDRRKKKREKQEMPKIKDGNAKVRIDIYNVLIEIRAYSGCNRVDIFEFSNGKYTHGGISLEVVNCTLEAVDNTTKGMINDFQNVPIATMLGTINLINENVDGWVRFDDCSDDELSNKRRRYWGIRTSYNFKITDTIWDGMVGLHWVSEYATLTKEEVNYIAVLIERVRILMAKLVKEK